MIHTYKEGQTNGKLYRISEIAERAGVSKRTVDYYTQLELLKPTRTDSGYRYYTEESLERLRLIELYKKERLSLYEIKQRLSVFDELQVPLQDVSRRIDAAEEKIQEAKEILLELQPVLTTLNEQQCNVLLRKLSVQGVSLSHLITLLLS
ncbi:MerR family transcriptional regulator [Aneurinibacillus danicus]|uniref:MerR family transcriptional regulator n=1 Tax=Aneurinibacillus danicus TaxID=267746 RepID=UPI0011BF2BFD|nr:MerR family transcriptional regulator [Aneurinibacillus danicus]